MTNYSNTPNVTSPYQACSVRHANNNSGNKITQCCYDVCSSWIDGTREDVINSECGKKCKSFGDNDANTNVTIDNQKIFKTCLLSADNSSDALGCCLTECNDNFLCQEKCIDSYNSLIESREGFLFGNMWEKSTTLIFLVVIINFIVLWSENFPWKTIGVSTLLYLLAYWLVQYI
jgi:hypothetical protein